GGCWPWTRPPPSRRPGRAPPPWPGRPRGPVSRRRAPRHATRAWSGTCRTRMCSGARTGSSWRPRDEGSRSCWDAGGGSGGGSRRAARRPPPSPSPPPPPSPLPRSPLSVIRSPFSASAADVAFREVQLQPDLLDPLVHHQGAVPRVVAVDLVDGPAGLQPLDVVLDLADGTARVVDPGGDVDGRLDLVD